MGKFLYVDVLLLDEVIPEGGTGSAVFDREGGHRLAGGRMAVRIKQIGRVKHISINI
jgi:hypothetical protein